MNETTRRRVVGAAVLLAMGILLPFALIQWLEGPTPDRNDDVRVYEITPDGEARPIADAGPRPQAAREERAQGPRAAPAQPEEGREPEPESEPVTDEETAGDARPDLAATEEADVAEPEPEPAEERPQPREPTVPPAEEETSGPSWSVQMGSFRSEDNARELMNELAGDYPAFYSEGEVEGVTYYRVRIGPYPSEAEAERAAAALAARGRQGQVRREP